MQKKDRAAVKTKQGIIIKGVIQTLHQLRCLWQGPQCQTASQPEKGKKIRDSKYIYRQLNGKPQLYKIITTKKSYA